MEDNYFLAKWLNDEMTETERAEFMASADFEQFEKIKKYTAHLKVADFDEAKVLEKVLNHKKATPKVIPMFGNRMLKYAAILVIALSAFFLTQNLVSETQYAENGKKTTFSLPDASEVVLNSGSEIKYKKWNWNSNRNLELKGEAFFKVAKGKRFEVTTDLGKVAVLGTQFGVKARESRFDVTCFEGRVKVNYKAKEIILTKGQSVSFENGIQTDLHLENLQPEWLNNEIAFNKAKLNAIVAEIQRQYNVTITVKSNYSDELFTGKLPTNNLDIALQIIAETYHLVPKKITSNQIIFEGK